MTSFTTRVDADAPALDVWSLVTDWPQHTRFVPLTRVYRTGSRSPGVGDCFVGRTGVGPLGFDDPMEVVGWVPPDGMAPGRCDLVKHGRVVRGIASIEVLPRTTSSCQVRWHEDVDFGPAWLSRAAAPLVRVGGAAAFGRVLRAMVAEVERGRP